MKIKCHRFKHLLSYTLICLLFFLSFCIIALEKIPSPTQFIYINDYVGIMEENDIQTILSIGQELEKKTSAEATIVIINSTEGLPIENYANHLFRTWGIGQKEKDNGLLLLVALDDHAWRVEVGRGLEGAIPDLLSHEIMTSLAAPAFQKGNYSQGLASAYNAFATTIAKEYNVSLEQASPVNFLDTTPPSKGNPLFIIIPLIIFLFIDLIFNRGRIFSFFLQMLFWSQLGGRNGRGGGSSGGGFGGGGFGGGSSNGGGSSGSW